MSVATSVTLRQISVPTRDIDISRYINCMGATSRTARDQLIAESPFCDLCGYNEHIDSLVIHHKDMDRRNNAASNLKVICANCHVRLHKIIQFLQNTRQLTPSEIYDQFKEAEVKGRNKAGKADGLTRTEGCEGSQSGATHSGTSRTDMNHHEAARRASRRSVLFKRYAELVRIYEGTEVRDKKPRR